MALISAEEIGLCRTGPDNDIDLQAVYGGRISGKKEKDLKVNPLYNDRNSVSQYSDINGNMSPVHVVTYESFPRSKTKILPAENGKIQNGDALQHTEVSRTDNSNNDLGVNAVVESDKTDTNHNIEERTKNEKLCEDKGSVTNLMHLKHKKSTSCEEYSEIKSDEIDNSRKNVNDINHMADVHIALEHTKGFRKDFSLLSYNNKSFVVDEKDVVIIPKQAEEINPNSNQYHEIQNVSGHESNLESDNKDESVSVVKESSVNPNSIQVDVREPNATNSSQNDPLENQKLDLPESTYHEICDVCDMQILSRVDLTNSCDSLGNLQENLSNLGESQQPCHKEIVTEVLVHNSAVLENPRMHYSEGNSMCYSFDTESDGVEIPCQAVSNDWPDISALVRPLQKETPFRPVAEIAQNDENRTENKGHIRSVSDVVILEKETNKDTEDKGDKSNVGDLDGSSLYKKKQKNIKSSSKAGAVNEAGSSTRTLKSILSNSSSHYSCSSENDHKFQNSDSEIHELKTVKFSEDTVFNENKSNKYKKEKFGQINLRDLYRGKIMSDAAIAKMNPLYRSDENTLEGGERDGQENGDADSDNLTYELTLRNALRLSKGKPGSLNSPSYLEQYLILKAHGIKKDNIDIEKLPETMERPVYDRLIQRTLAKERRKVCVKWSMVILTVAVITAIATTLGVYFKEGF